MRRLDSVRSSVVAAEVDYVDSAGSAHTTLGEIHFGASPVDAGDAAHPVAWVGMPLLSTGSRVETWSSNQPVVYQRSGPLVFSRNRDFLFGCLTADSPEEFAVFEARVQEAYARLLTLVDVEGFPHLLRMWNYFPGLHQQEGNLDRYMVFSRGRHRAIEAHFGGRFTGHLPAASAVGSRHGGLVIYFLAGRQPGRHRENPRQISAYCYPSRYGPKSPSFARGTLYRLPDEDVFYISGTASIVGHESLHPGDVSAQLDETLINIRSLLESTAAEEGVDQLNLASVSLAKVYLRNRSDLATVRSRLEGELAAGTRCIYVEADICRPELMLEIEAIARTTVR